MGRRFGKTRLSAFEAVCTAALGGWVMLAAPTYDLADIDFQECVLLVTGNDLGRLVFGTPNMAKGNQIIQFETGGRIVAKSTDTVRGLVGRGWDLLIFDEAAKEPDREIFHRYLRPALSDREGGAIFPSTPEGDNWYKDLWEKGRHGAPGYSSWQLSSRASPLMSEAEFRSLMEGMTSDDFNQEILALFLDATGSVFRGYREAATASWRDRPEKGRRYVMGVDIAQHQDWTVIGIMDVGSGEIVHLIRFNQMLYTEQELVIIEASRLWNNAPILIDATNNEGTAEHIAEKAYWTDVQKFKFTMLSKPEVINQLKLGMETGELRIPADHPDLPPDVLKLIRMQLSELGAFRYERSPSGHLRMGAPTGRHDDIVIALALAYEMSFRAVGGRPIAISTGGRAPAVRIGSGGGPPVRLGRKTR